ncbi:DNA/RNA helicase domain-containing protein [Roseivirga sp.]|uniref:DNA/RNA helicase domain-containing protein n=1 Tax=Roseivirga sp. TaxID=1964215 RepID=UPI003B51FCE5
MQPVNLNSFANLHDGLQKNDFELYLKAKSISIKQEEILDLKSFIYLLKSASQESVVFENFHICFQIPQIGKEFDLLRIDESLIINIELKSEFDEERIITQHKRNEYYLRFLKRKIFSYTFISNKKEILGINPDGQLYKTGISEIIDLLKQQDHKYKVDTQNIFNPSDYLVSPFNSTLRFLRNEYFLTNHQEDIKKIVLNSLQQNKTFYIGIEGKAGTGKSLLVYSIAQETQSRFKTLIAHVGMLNEGHNTLIWDYGWEIVYPKQLNERILRDYEFIIIDEAQRLKPSQLELLINSGRSCLFAFDGVQTLSKKEIANSIPSKIEEVLTTPLFKLKTKIRTNPEISDFINALFQKNRAPKKQFYPNVQVLYFIKRHEGKEYIKFLLDEDCKVINYTPQLYGKSKYEYLNTEDITENAHSVIGQEFECVVGVLDGHFYYKPNGTLSTQGYPETPIYHPTKMLYQILSRTKSKLKLIIIDNPEVMSRCLEILTANQV